MPTSALLRGLLPACLALLGGCSQWHYELGTPIDETAMPRAGERPHLQQVLDVFGPPLHLSASDGGYVMAWEYWWIREQSIGFNLGPLGADFLAIDAGALHTRGEHIVMTFDRDHRMSAASYSSWDTRAGGGMGIQPLGIVSVVDGDDLNGNLPQQEWGAALLAEDEITINRQSSTGTGQNGIEQRGTPRDIGQNSLELD